MGAMLPVALSKFALARGLLWNVNDATNWVQKIAHSEAAFLELAKHHFPEVYSRLRAVAQPTPAQSADAVAVAPPSVAAPSSQVQPPVSLSNAAAATNLAAAAAPAPRVAAAAPRHSTRRSVRQRGPAMPPAVHAVPQPGAGASGSGKATSYPGQPNTGPRKVVDAKTRERYDKKSGYKKVQREVKKQKLQQALDIVNASSV